MIKNILYIIILLYIQTVVCIIPNKKIIITNNKAIIMSQHDCCYPINNKICNLLYNFWKTESLKNKKIFILKKKLTDEKALNRIINKKVDALITKKSWIYIKMIDHYNLINEINNNINTLKQSNNPKYRAGYSLFLNFFNRNADKYIRVNATNRNVFIRKIKFNLLSEDIKVYTNIIEKPYNKKNIHIYNNNKKLECKNNTNYKILPIISSINYNYTPTTQTLTRYNLTTFNSKISSDYKIITSSKTINPTISFNNYSVINYNYITTTSNILLTTQSNNFYTYTSINIPCCNNFTTTKPITYSSVNTTDNFISYYYTTHKNKANAVIHNNYYKKAFISIAIILPILVIFIVILIIYKYCKKSKKKQIMYATTQDHIYEIPNSVIHENNQNANYEYIPYEDAIDLNTTLPSNSNIINVNNQHENTGILSIKINKLNTPDYLTIINSTDELDSYDLQNEFIEHEYNVLENVSSIINEDS